MPGLGRLQGRVESSVSRVSLKPLTQIRAGEHVEATVSIVAVQRFAGRVRLLLKSDDGESAHARVSAALRGWRTPGGR
ncbi:hypothetical protein [Streptomyces sp. NPDC058295]|uniref:hypothetical protein n=1 Tax=Streptomyces sp. NPDC058295 TaxID=3346431 RepID=UPI0036EDC36E